MIRESARRMVRFQLIAPFQRWRTPCTFGGASAARFFEPNVSSPACSAPTFFARSTRGAATGTARVAFVSSSAARWRGGAAPISPPRLSAGASIATYAKLTARFYEGRALGSGATAWVQRLTRGTRVGSKVDASRRAGTRGEVRLKLLRLRLARAFRAFVAHAEGAGG